MCIIGNSSRSRRMCATPNLTPQAKTSCNFCLSKRFWCLVYSAQSYCAIPDFCLFFLCVPLFFNVSAAFLRQKCITWNQRSVCTMHRVYMFFCLFFLTTTKIKYSVKNLTSGLTTYRKVRLLQHNLRFWLLDCCIPMCFCSLKSCKPNFLSGCDTEETDK